MQCQLPGMRAGGMNQGAIRWKNKKGFETQYIFHSRIKMFTRELREK